MKLLLGLTLAAGAFAQANPETFFYSDTTDEPSKYVGLVTKDSLGSFPAAGTSISPFEGYAYNTYDNWVAEIAPDGTVTVLAIYSGEFFGLFLGVEVGATGAFEGGQAVEVTGFANSDPSDFDDTFTELPPFIAYDASGRLWTGDFTECDNGDALTQVWWGTIDYTADPAVFTGHFQVAAPAPDIAYDDYLGTPSYLCPWSSYYNDVGFSVLGNYLYLEFYLYWDGFGFWAISLDTEGVYTRTIENMIWATWYYGIGDDEYPFGAVDRGQGVFFVASYDSSVLDTGIWLQYFDFSCDPAAIVRFDPTPFVYDDTNGDQDWERPVAAGREFYYCNWPAGVCEDGVINDNFVLVGDGLVESECASVPTGACGSTWIGCADGYLPFGFIAGQETCNRTASEVGWTTNSWGASVDTFECEFGAGGATTECFDGCRAVAKSVEYRGDELQFEVTCYRCDDPIVIDIARREERFTPVTDDTGFGAVVVAVGCDVGDVDCCNFVLRRAQCEAGVELDLCFCGLADIDCPDPDCNESKKGLLGLLGLLGLIPLSLCCLLLLLCLIRRKKAGAPVPVATFDACAPPVFDAGVCTAAPTFASAGAPLGYPGTFVA